MPSETFNGCMKRPDLVSGGGLDQIQEPACTNEICIKAIGNLEPGNVVIRSLNDWQGVGKLIILGQGSREKVCSRLSYFLGRIE